MRAARRRDVGSDDGARRSAAAAAAGPAPADAARNAFLAENDRKWLTYGFAMNNAPGGGDAGNAERKAARFFCLLCWSTNHRTRRRGGGGRRGRGRRGGGERGGAGAARAVQPAAQLVSLAPVVAALPHQVVDHPLEPLQTAHLLLRLRLSGTRTVRAEQGVTKYSRGNSSRNGT